jgi:allene oxide cyclase-like protein
MTAHRSTTSTRTSLTRQCIAHSGLALALAAAVLGTLVATGSAAEASQPQKFKLLEVVTSVVGTAGFDVKSNRPPAVGQGAIVDGSFYKLNGREQGARYGTLHVFCTFIDSRGTSVCTAVVSLPPGKIVASGRTPGSSGMPYSIPIAGGDGAYAGATGHIAIKPIGGKAVDTFVITG